MNQTAVQKHFKHRKHPIASGILMLYLCLFVWFTLIPSVCRAQNEPQYEEISVFLNIQRFGGTEIPAVINDETVYLPVT